MEDTKSIHYFIAADVGGTNARFRIVKRSTADHTYRDLVLQKVYPVKDYDSIDSIIMNVMGSINAKIKYMTLAIAGPKEGNTIRITNVPSWPIIDGDAIREKFGFEQFNLLNDFESNGYGTCALGIENSEDFIVLQAGEPVEKEPKVILGPGTGLGCALIIYNHDEGCYNVVRGEGGHTEFTVTNESELKLREFCVEWFREREGFELTRISVERMTAGPALPMIYEFFRQQNPDLAVVCETNEETKEASGSEIVNKGVNDRDPLCLMVINQFLKQLAIFASDMALVACAAGGVYLTGGVVEALAGYMQSEDCEFFKHFHNKGRFSEYIKKVPVYLFAQTPGLDGAEQFGVQNVVHHH